MGCSYIESIVNLIIVQLVRILLGLNPEIYEEMIRASWLWKELYAVRNVRPSFKTNLGLYGGVLYMGLIHILMRGKEPWTLSHGGRIYTYFEAILSWDFCVQ